MIEITLKNGHKVAIRSPKVEDAEEMVSLMSQVDTETKFLAREPGEFKTTVEREREIIQAAITDSDSTWFIAEYNKKVVGQCYVGLVRRNLRYRHRAEVAFVILEKYCNLGIGGKLMEKCIEWCKVHDIEQVELDVVTNNERAVKMYKDFGFEIVGTIPNALRYKEGTYTDEYFMVKKL